MALWSLARKHQPSNPRNDGLESNLREAVGRDVSGEACKEGPGTINGWAPSFLAHLPLWVKASEVFASADWRSVSVACLLSRLSPKGSLPHEECFCVISETAVEDVALGHQCKSPWETGQPLTGCLAWCFWFVISKTKNSTMQCGSLFALASKRPRAKLYAQLK